VALLYRLRKHVEGEVAAWCGVAILAVLSVMWSNYTDEFVDPENIRLAQSGVYGERWLVLE
jgi:hypothetical protein